MAVHRKFSYSEQSLAAIAPLTRRTILKTKEHDVSSLPLDAREAFFLSRLDGQLSVQEVAEVAGVALDDALRLAKRLIDLRAVSMVEPSRARAAKRSGTSGVAIEEVAQVGRSDPRADDAPRSQRSPRSERIDPRSDPRAEPAEQVERKARESIQPESQTRQLVEREERETRTEREEPSPEATPPKNPSRKSLRPARMSRQLKAEKQDKQVEASAAPVPKIVMPAPVTAARRSSKRVPAVIVAGPAAGPVVEPPPGVAAGFTVTPERIRQLREAATEVKVQEKIDLLVSAAEEALRANDFVKAANNFRLALSHRDAPHLRVKYEEVEARARIVRFEKNIQAATGAERDERWADAAVFLERAYEARADADVAARAATALRRSQGDLDRAAALAGRAVSKEPKNIGYHITLAEVHLAANRFAAAEAACESALALAPKDVRAKDLAAAIAVKKTKAQPTS